MELKVGDFVEFKKYEDMTVYDTSVIPEEDFPVFGKIEKVTDPVEGVTFFLIEGNTCFFSEKSVEKIISDVDGVDINSLKPGDEVLVKANLNEIFEDNIYVTSKINKKNVVKILKRKEPEHFIVKEGHYGMYVNGSEVLVVNKDDAKIFDSRNEANETAADMHLNAWDVIPYDD